MDFFELNQRTAVITGCSNETAKATACALATAGDEVIAALKDLPVVSELTKKLATSAVFCAWRQRLQTRDSGPEKNTLSSSVNDIMIILKQ